ncbi:hypothetical protein B0H13DRAFT_2670485 [Mycena leptocephala]|nr:hypothetical protein B0H13DRAFT_2670485 [Mycena leptocephala]
MGAALERHRTEKRGTNDVNRQKTVIRPRCEYVQKQKQHSIRTPCFSATFQNSDENEKTLDHDPNPDADPEPDVAIKDIVTSFAVKDAKKTENSVLERDVHEREIAAHEAPNSITNQTPSIDLVHEESVAQETPSGAAHRTASNVSSGRTEKPPRSPPRTVEVPDLPMDAYSAVVSAQYELYSCGCSAPEECVQCTLRRPADKFCAIVAERDDFLKIATGFWARARIRFK